MFLECKIGDFYFQAGVKGQMKLGVQISKTFVTEYSKCSLISQPNHHQTPPFLLTQLIGADGRPPRRGACSMVSAL